MVVPDEYRYDYWSKEPAEKETVLTCFMPNGMLILIPATQNSTFAEIKEDLWFEAQRLPMYGKLHDMSVYVFMFMNVMAELEEITDESMRLIDVRPMCAILKITELSQDKDKEEENTMLNKKIGQLIGKKLPEFDAMNNSEINDFRFKMRKLGDEILTRKQKQTWSERLNYQYPPRICKSKEMLNQILDNVTNTVYSKDRLYIIGKIAGNSDHSFKCEVHPKDNPTALLEMIIKRKGKFLPALPLRLDDYVLKVCGYDEYLVGNYPLIAFEYIRECILRDVSPTVVAVCKDDVPIMESDYDYLPFQNNKKFSTLTLRKKGNIMSSWKIDSKLEITLSTVSKLNSDRREIGLQVGLFHGSKSLCQPQNTSLKTVADGECAVNETLEFDIRICDVPRCAKLCFAIYESGKGTKTRKVKESANKFLNPIAWANTTVFDFKNQLKVGAMTLYMWTYAEDMMLMNDDILHPLGTVVHNLNKTYATSLTVTFPSYSDKDIVQFPSIQQIYNYVQENQEKIKVEETYDKSKDDLDKLMKIFRESDNIYEVHDQDRKAMWKYRNHWKWQAPDILPKLLHCIDWDKRDEVSEIMYMLQDWPKLPVEKALELLDYAYPDQQVRMFAVSCLRIIDDEDLLLYLLQLVQALKHELFLDCDLVKYLLEKSLYNQKIGHYLFWHLRSETQVLSVSVRFGLILEAYCRGSQDHMPILAKQLDCLQKLKTCSELVRKKDKEKGRLAILSYLNQVNSDNLMKNLTSPLDPIHRCNGIRLEKIKVMDSKMRPIWVVMENSDAGADDVYIIFKNGDDLRQDMLTLQMLRIMDKLWKQAGHDFRMNPYKCISMEYRIGMIEVVLNADTIANIQKEKGIFTATSAFRKESILAWLKDHNKTEAALEKAIEEFTLSCAGYCVATYVLGVGDRHSDNIMVKKNGQLFHIDFGHILGHFKEKFGFKRERVPFVLTHDFVHVIIKGQKNNANGIEFKLFQSYCEKAFLILRRHGELILSLFAMMISTGLPELTSEKDLNYLKETLVLSKTENEALEHFKSKFEEALSNSWKTSMNWATHNISKSNKTN